jgi:hypothetical protein
MLNTLVGLAPSEVTRILSGEFIFCESARKENWIQGDQKWKFWILSPGCGFACVGIIIYFWWLTSQGDDLLVYRLSHLLNTEKAPGSIPGRVNFSNSDQGPFYEQPFANLTIPN